MWFVAPRGKMFLDFFRENIFIRTAEGICLFELTLIYSKWKEIFTSRPYIFILIKKTLMLIVTNIFVHYLNEFFFNANIFFFSAVLLETFCRMAVETCLQ